MTHAGSREIDVAIIGAGPIGIELAIALRQAGIRVELLDAGNVGSTFTWWARGTRFFSSPERISIAGVPLVTAGQDKATREEYLAYLRAVVAQFNLPITSGTRVSDIAGCEGAFTLNSSNAGPIRAARVVLAIGNMHAPRLLGVPGEDLAHVSHYLRDPHLYFGRRVVIVGGKNSAVEAAIRLHRVGARVTMCYRGESFDPRRVKYWLRPELEWLIQKRRIVFHPRTSVEAIDERHIIVRGTEPQQERIVIPADDVLLMTGYVPDTTLFERLGVPLDGEERAPRHDPQTMQTSVSGVYVAGTVAGGSQRRARLFIENSHVHVQRILRHIAGVDLPWKTDDDYAALEEA